MEPYGIALIGCGTVGSGVAKLLLEQPERLAARAGRPLVLRRVVVKHPDKPRPVQLPAHLVSTDLHSVLHDPSIHVGVEVVGGISWARQAVLDLLQAGKDVVTANKALLAEHGLEVFAAARRHGRAIAFEASVAGGIPIIVALTQGLAANQILSLQGILNGTSNFILTAMSEHGQSYQEALAEAQRRGYAEADPTLDVNGTDAAHKLAILAQIAFGVSIPPSAISRRGIDQVQQADIRYGQELGYTIKLLAEAWLDAQPDAALSPFLPGEGRRVRAHQLALHVAPVMLRHLAPLAQVREAYNAIQVVGDAVGTTLYFGRGAGQMPTASSVVADLIDLAVGRAQQTFQTLRLWTGNSNAITLRSSATVPSRFYLRLLVQDRPGVLADVARILAEHKISIASVIQHEAPQEQEGEGVALVIMTHQASTGSFLDSLKQLDRLDCVTPPSVYYHVGD